MPLPELVMHALTLPPWSHIILGQSGGTSEASSSFQKQLPQQDVIAGLATPPQG
jgi:hypothetical protein